jgi:acyl dehydratase
VLIRGFAVNERWLDRVGDIVALSKSVSEADIALYELISRDDAFVPEDPTPPRRQPRQMGPYPFLASLLAAAAAYPVSLPAQASFRSQQIEFAAPMYTDDTLYMTVEIVAYDEAARTIAVTVNCQNQDQQHLAHGTFTLDVSTVEPAEYSRHANAEGV